MQTDLNGERLYDLRLTQINFRGRNDDVSFHISKYFVYKKAPATACVEQLAPFTSSQPHLIAKAEASDILWRKACIHHLLPSVTAQSSWPQKQSASDVDLDTGLRTTRTDQNIPVSNGLIGVNKALSLKLKFLDLQQETFVQRLRYPVFEGRLDLHVKFTEIAIEQLAE